MQWEQDVLALPLFGISENFPKAARDSKGPRLSGHYWSFESGSRLGVLYVAADRDSIDPVSLSLLKRFADRVGIIASLALHQEKLVGTVTKLQRERQWIESIMKSVADPIVLTDLDNEILLQNRRAEELFSGSANAGEGKRRALKMNDLLFSAYLSSATVSSSEVIQRDITLVDPIEGSDIHFEVISTPAANSRGEPLGLVSIFRDVTDLREANEELARNFDRLQQAEADSRRERDRLDLIIENVGHPIVVCDSAGNFILFNRRAELLFEEKSSFRPAAMAAVRTNAVKLTSFISGLASASETGRQAEIELIDPDGGRLLPMEITAREVLDATGQVTAVVSILHDLTEIRELERRRVEQQLFESEKLAAVGRLAASLDRVIVKEDEDPRGRRRGEVAELLREGLREGGMQDDRVEVVLDERYGGPEYGLPSEGTLEAIRLCARLEGVLTDPVYEGKSMHGMIDRVRRREFPPGTKVLYAHLGGVPALSAYSSLFPRG